MSFPKKSSESHAIFSVTTFALSVLDVGYSESDVQTGCFHRLGAGFRHVLCPSYRPLEGLSRLGKTMPLIEGVTDYHLSSTSGDPSPSMPLAKVRHNL